MPDEVLPSSAVTVPKKDLPNEVKLQKLENGDYRIVVDGVTHHSTPPFSVVNDSGISKWLRALKGLADIVEIVTKKN